MVRKREHPLTVWRNKQEPPWPVTYIAKKIGMSDTWLSTVTNFNKGKRCSPELAYAIELLTNGEVTMLDMLIEPGDRRKIEARIKNGK